jgi:hypothetical protein
MPKPGEIIVYGSQRDLLKKLILEEFENDKSKKISEYELVESVFIRCGGKFNRIQILNHLQWMGGPGNSKFWLDWSGHFAKTDDIYTPRQDRYYSITDDGIKKLKDVIEEIKREHLENPRCYISYAHSSREHMDWVLNLASDLRQNGVDVVLDQWDLRAGEDLMEFMERGIRESEKVLIVCDKKYCEKANCGIGGVGYEKNIITSEIYNKENPLKFIPILRQGGNTNIPSFIGSKIYVDFQKDADYGTKLDELLHEIYNIPNKTKPVLGRSPF